ncbi:hypothetical protein FRB91_004883 [Serendipita sp. 411]|nr:hypothetical protein FRC18_003738 [Serendipita sp. 400]KAG8822178.1 hypothetical protein FRC19_006584 [Serendipita sp. 401]KAG8853463.1 hypothetical protein FRB91_004883 [Serendipita sp. 411]KAG9042175.1 hypothetical protein FS842_002274 [Serendipita sp. 407]
MDFRRQAVREVLIRVKYSVTLAYLRILVVVHFKKKQTGWGRSLRTGESFAYNRIFIVATGISIATGQVLKRDPRNQDSRHRILAIWRQQTNWDTPCVASTVVPITADDVNVY